MNTEIKDIEQKLTRLSDKLAVDATMADDVMRRIETAKPATAAPRWRLVPRTLALAACLAAVLIGAWAVVVNLPPNGLYAKAVAALADARSVVATSSRWHDGKWVVGAEVVYERGVGVYERVEHRGVTRVRIDDGKNEWRFDSDSLAVRKSPTRDTKGAVREILRESAKAINESKRDPSGDRTIDGVPCRLYALEVGGRTRYRAWIDEADRIRRFEEEQLRDGEWVNEELAEVSYDVPIDRGVFVPKLPANARVIEPEATLAQAFDLEKAKYRQETSGFIFAVHRVEKLADGWFLVVSSLRPTESTRREIGSDRSGPAAHNYGSLMMESSFKRFKEDPNRMRSYQMCTLAQAYHDGMDVQWTLFKPSGAWELEADVFDVSWRYSASGKLAQKLQSQGKETWATFKSVAQIVADQRETTTVTAAAGEVYDEIELLETIVANAALQLKSVPFSDQEMETFHRETPGEPRRWKPGSNDGRMYHGRAQPPSRVTRQQFLAELDARLTESAERRR